MPLYGYARVSTLDQDRGLQRAALEAAGCGVIRAETAGGTRRDGGTELQALLDFVQPGDTLVVTRIGRLARSMKNLQDIVHELKAKGVALRATEQPVDTGTAAGEAFLDMLGVFAEFETNLRRERQLEAGQTHEQPWVEAVGSALTRTQLAEVGGAVFQQPEALFGPGCPTQAISCVGPELEGIKAAKGRGVYKRRKPSIDAAEVRRLREQEKLGHRRRRSHGVMSPKGDRAAIAKRLGIGRASVHRVLGAQTSSA